MSKVLRKLASLAAVATVAGTSVLSVGTFAATAEGTSANAMSPLHINNWSSFQSDLSKASQIGIDAISVDVWWGDVEKNGDNQFDFSYYDKVFQYITNAGLDIVPIMSFHQCGGNVGDDYTSLLPNWVWSKYGSKSINGVKLTADNLKYKSSQGNSSKEYLAVWADDVVNNEYIDFMNAFEDHYANYASDMQEINISGGPSGELRYPSYNSHDNGTGYPTKGALQAYSNLAKVDFRKAMLEKYNSLAGINRAWGTSMTDESQINPPSDGDNFFYSNGSHPYYESQYGKDFVDWYNGSLVNHADRMLGYAREAFDGAFKDVPLGMKIPGVHWQMQNTTTPRGAEVSAGLISSDFSSSNAYGYKPTLKMMKENNATLHFTCLEMNDNNGEATSAPKTLVRYIGDAAESMGVVLKGENALSGGEDYEYYWNNITDAINNHGYDGITILRLPDAVDGNSYNYYRNFINNHPYNRTSGTTSSPSPTASTDPSVQAAAVNFSVNATTNWGQNVYVVGNASALGNWNPDNAVILSSANYPTWSNTIEELPTNSTITFKFIKKDGNGNVTWESGDNRTVQTGSKGSTVNFSGSWK